MKLQQKTIKKIRELINEETEYRSGPELVVFFSDLGFQDSYGQGFPSRWAYTEDRLNNINGTQKIKACIMKLFAPINFIGKFDDLDRFIFDLNQYLNFDGYRVIRSGKTIKITVLNEDAYLDTNSTVTEDEFLKKEFKEISLSALKLDRTITDILEQRFKEIKKCLNSKAALATILLCGSTLEGVLLNVATSNLRKFNSAKTSPKDKNGKVLQFDKWTLGNFIDVAKETEFLDEDVKKFSHSLRDFRNYIHPHLQARRQFNPDENTAKLCWQVLKMAIFQIIKKSLKSKKKNERS